MAKIGYDNAQVFDDKVGQAARGVAMRDTQRIDQEIQEVQKTRAELFMDANVLLKGFDKDINGELTQDRDALRQATREILRKEGTNPESIAKIYEVQNNLAQKITESQSQKQYVAGLEKKLQNFTADKYFDIEQSLKNIEEFKAMSIKDRMSYDKPLLVRKVDQYNPFDPPRNTMGPDGVNPQRLTQQLQSDPEVREHYERGMEQASPLWQNEKEYQTFLEREWDVKYKNRTPRSTTLKGITENGDVRNPNDAQDYKIDSPGQFMFGNNSVTFDNRYAISQKGKAENYGVVTFIVNGESQPRTESLDNVIPIEYATNTNTNEDWMYGMRKIKKKVPPTPEELQLAQAENRFDYEFQQLTEQQQIESLTKEKYVTEYLWLNLSGLEELQTQRRKNIYGAFKSSHQQQNFNQQPVSNQLEDVFSIPEDEDTNEPQI